jgi:hypothetical protein
MGTRDETDGTPEWAKRMFRRLRAARWRFVVYMFFVILPAFGAFRLLQATVRGEVWHERSDKWISYSAEPGKFLTEIAIWLIAVNAPILFVIFRARYPDRMRRLQDTIRSRYKCDPASRGKYR